MMRYLLLLIIMGLFSLPAEAGDIKAAPANPHVGVVMEKAQKLAKTLTREEAEKLGQIRENFGILRSIGVARKSVGEAVGLCAKANPDLATQINERHAAWDKDIGAGLTRQEENLEKAIKAANFSNPEQIRDYLGSIDDMAVYSDNQIDKKIITTPSACQNLINSMDDTSKVILGLIGDMTWPQAKTGGAGGVETP